MILSFFVNKFKSLLFVFVNIFKQVFFCGKRTSTSDAIPLTHVISNKEYSPEWTDWDESNTINETKAMNDYENAYQEKKQLLESTDCEEQLNFFDDMTPHITKQIKIFVDNDVTKTAKNISTNRLSLVEDIVII